MVDAIFAILFDSLVVALMVIIYKLFMRNKRLIRSHKNESNSIFQETIQIESENEKSSLIPELGAEKISMGSRPDVRIKKKPSLRRIFLWTLCVVIVFLIGGFYYVSGTPEYSLFMLKRAIKLNNYVDFEKYLDIQGFAEERNETQPNAEKQLMDSFNTSFLEVWEENPDSSKNADKFIPTGLTGRFLKKASIDTSSHELAILLEFDENGKTLFSEITKRNVGKQIAIYLGGQLVSAPVVQIQQNDGLATITANDPNWSEAMVTRINAERKGIIEDLKIKKRDIDGDLAHITIGVGVDDQSNNIDLTMVRMRWGYWRVTKFNRVFVEDRKKLPEPDGEKLATFEWKYKGKKYSLDEKLYESYYKTYNSLPDRAFFNGESAVGWEEKNNNTFLNGVSDDHTMDEVAASLKLIGDKNNFDDNQLAELVATFVQTIPYDYEKYDNRQAGLNGVAEQPTYPYEVLYENKGVCQDKTYLTYSLLQKLGFGVSIFVFPEPEDNHMALGIKCPMEYSSYDSGYCFFETTLTGNKIGIIPKKLPKSDAATSNIKAGSFGDDQDENQYNPLGRVEITNITDGKMYTGIIETISTQKEIDKLLSIIVSTKKQLRVQSIELDNRRDNLSDLLKKANRAAKGDSISDYEHAVSKYENERKSFNKDVKEYNIQIVQLNSSVVRYNSLIKEFYQ